MLRHDPYNSSYYGPPTSLRQARAAIVGNPIIKKYGAALNTHLGLELTWHSDFYPNYSALTKRLAAFAQKAGMKGGWPGAHDGSCHTLEINSPKLINLNHVALYYNEAADIANRLKLKVVKHGWQSGGGHIHVSSKSKTRFTINMNTRLITAAVNQPWLSWVFNDYTDDDTACNPLSYFESISLGDCFNRTRFVGSKQTSINICVDRVELRFFDAPFNLDEQLLHAVFADRWVNKIVTDEAKGKLIEPLRFIQSKQFLKLGLEQCEAEFKALLVELKLDPDDYQVFIKRNLRPLFRGGYPRA